jgi:small subunit ribosomal protein S5
MQQNKRRQRREPERREFDKEAWIPKTELGKKAKKGEITLDEILNKGHKILESEIVDTLLPDLQTDLIAIGQSKGKFGGGKRSIWRQTQKKTREGNKPKFATMAIVGNNQGYLGLGFSKAKETVPARERAIRKAKLNIIKLRRGCGSWACGCKKIHSIPFKVSGKQGSAKIILMPSPKGVGLCVEKECQKLLKLAGIEDVHSKTFGQTKTKINLIKACFEALKELSRIKITKEQAKRLGVVDE